VGITKELPTVISFCSGYGGIERGLDLAGLEHRVIAYVEIEAFAIANLVNKMEAGQLPPAPIYTNLKTFPAHLFRDRVDLITGGYPCQPFSAAGQRKGTDDPRHLWPFIRGHIKTIEPSSVFFENVEGHISLGLSTVISDLEEDGYRATWGIFSAREVGAPHQRKRVYILADSISKRSQGRLSGREDTERESELRYLGCSGTALQRGQEQSWPPEPRLGRVVDGCADRVDRIRMLGNGVVPQTAAKAYLTLKVRGLK
jgi:DNA (cytosine-5)-methyltransferase 1